MNDFHTHSFIAAAAPEMVGVGDYDFRAVVCRRAVRIPVSGGIR